MAHPIQTKAWADLRKEQGHTPVWVGNCLMLVKKLSFPFKSFGLMSQVDLNDLSVSELIKKAKELNLSHVQIDPANEVSDLAAKQLLANLKPAAKGESLVPRVTNIIDLTLSEQEILAGMKKNWRYNIKLASEKGLHTSEESNEEGLETFLDLYFETVAKKKFLGRNRNYFRQVWQKMHSADLAHIFITYMGEKPLVARMVFKSQDSVFTVYTGTNRELSEAKAAYLAVWNLILWAKEHGFKNLNMWGANPEAKVADSDFGYSQFKLGFGGRIAYYLPAKDLIISPLYYWLFKIINKIRLFALRAKAGFR